ncbi:MAG: DUF3105 domain-containing protein [Dermatophilaceae bacterium]
MSAPSHPTPGAEPGRSRTHRIRVRVIAGVLVLLVVAAVIGIQAVRRTAMEQDVVMARDTSAVRHVTTPVVYDDSPPTRGDHHAVWWNCGRYDRPIPAEHVVHSLEHGAVWLTYRPDVATTTVDALERLAARSHLVLSPFPGQRWPVVATAWGVQLRQEEFDEKAVQRFIVAHRMSERAPEPGAACSGGTETDLVERP